MSEDQNRIRNLDGLRAIAILLVIGGHLRYNLWPLNEASSVLRLFASFASMGVDIFFAISGYLITNRLLLEFQKNNSIRFTHFYIRRFFRLIPALGMYLAILLMVGALIPTISVSWSEIAASALFYRNYFTGGDWFTAHFWSLAVEEHYYLFFPLLLFFILRKPFKVSAALASVSIAFVIWYYVDTSLIHSFEFLDPHTRSDYRMPSLLFGAAVGARHYFKSEVFKMRAPAIWIILSATFLACLIGKAPLAMVWRPILIAEIVGCVVAAERHWNVRYLEWPVLKWVGRTSYSIYLWQQLFLVPFDHNVGIWFAAFPINIIFVFVCAALSYYLVEKPLIKIGQISIGRLSCDP